jgi:hypothetical protein
MFSKNASRLLQLSAGIFASDVVFGYCSQREVREVTPQRHVPAEP